MTSKHKQIVFGIIAVIGLCATWYYNIQIMTSPEGFSVGKFIADNYVNAASASISNDLTVVTLLFVFWSFLESRRLAMKHWWLYIVLTFTVAIAFAFPLFMLFRERHLSPAETR